MKIVRFKYDGVIRWGVYEENENKVITLELGLEDGIGFEEVIKGVNKIHDQGEKIMYLLDDVELLVPIKPTQNILCIGKNYVDHIKEFDGDLEQINQVKENPIFFTKSLNSINNPYGNIPSHSDITDAVDYEAELGVVIGKKGINIKADEAMDYIYGFTIVNDVTARDLQKKHNQWFKGKSLDGFSPVGPWVVTKDEIENINELVVSSRVNGELRQEGKVELMIHKIEEIISILSKGATLNPGDIISTGTPKGVGMGFNPPKLLKKGDIVRIEISNIGYIENKII